jgi:hypothetical protein
MFTLVIWFSSKVEAWQPTGDRAAAAAVGMEALHIISAPSVEKKQSVKAPTSTSGFYHHGFYQYVSSM